MNFASNFLRFLQNENNFIAAKEDLTRKEIPDLEGNCVVSNQAKVFDIFNEIHSEWDQMQEKFDEAITLYCENVSVAES